MLYLEKPEIRSRTLDVVLKREKAEVGARTLYVVLKKESKGKSYNPACFV